MLLLTHKDRQILRSKAGVFLHPFVQYVSENLQLKNMDTQGEKIFAHAAENYPCAIETVLELLTLEYRPDKKLLLLQLVEVYTPHEGRERIIASFYSRFDREKAERILQVPHK